MISFNLKNHIVSIKTNKQNRTRKPKPKTKPSQTKAHSDSHGWSTVPLMLQQLLWDPLPTPDASHPRHRCEESLLNGAVWGWGTMWESLSAVKGRVRKPSLGNKYSHSFPISPLEPWAPGIFLSIPTTAVPSDLHVYPKSHRPMRPHDCDASWAIPHGGALGSSKHGFLVLTYIAITIVSVF